MKRNDFHIAVMPGDGIGVEVMDAAVAVLEAVERRHGFSVSRELVAGGAQHYRDTGSAMTEQAFDRAAKVDAKTGAQLSGAAPGKPIVGGVPCAAYIGENAEFTVGVNNIADKDPPITGASEAANVAVMFAPVAVAVSALSFTSNSVTSRR